MAVSSLASITVPAYAGNYTKGRNNTKVRCVTVHHMAGVLSAEACGKIFQAVGRNGSSHYGIGNDGQIASYVDESNIAWTNSNWASNCESITIETSNSAIGGNWPVSEAAFNSLVKLVADIAKRNDLGTLVPGENLTWHSMFTATSCPGPYLQDRIHEIADKANEMNKVAPVPEPTPAPTPSVGGFKQGDKVVPKTYVDYNGTRLVKTRDYYYVMANPQGNRVVLTADSVNGPIYAAMKADNLTKVGDAPAPAPAPTPAELKVGDRVTLNNYVSYNGVRLAKTRDYYYISQINGDRVVLVADSQNGPVYAAVSKGNLRRY